MQFLSFIIVYSLEAYAVGDSTNIGISLEIKSKLACRYTVVFDGNANIENSDSSLFCDQNPKELHRYVHSLINYGLRDTESSLDGNPLRVFMIVQ